MNTKRDDPTTGDNSSDFGRPLSLEEEAEAKRFMEIARRAEMKALEKLEYPKKTSTVNGDAAKFLTKKEREALALQRLQDQREENERREQASQIAHKNFVTGKTVEDRKRLEKIRLEEEERARAIRCKEDKKEAKEFDNEIKSIRDHYLGGVEKKRKITKPSEKFAKIFQFEWETEDDTGRNDFNPLYTNKVKINALFGRGYLAGADQREQRKDSSFLMSLSEKRMMELNSIEEADELLTTAQRQERVRARDQATRDLRRRQLEESQIIETTTKAKLGSHWSEKPLESMTERDWRIFREDYDIRIQGGRATLPLRYWNEAGFPDVLMQAIEAVNYKEPSPIQRQAIPIGLAGRDIIGIAETGSGKTAAFVIPMLSYLLQLPPHYVTRCAEEGPLAMVMAPTRELAQQIEEECVKLARFTGFQTICVVGGQDIELQGYRLHKGVQVIVGTPGRLQDCMEHNLLVLNQCNYVVLDEADRMVDMGFEPQVWKLLDSMGGLLKSEDEAQAELQLAQVASKQEVYRVMAMFSATMPVEVERIAKKYLRHPAIIRIGDEDTGKNKRIEQRVHFVTEGQKKSKIHEELQRLAKSDKAIIFVNAKKQCDFIGRHLETLCYRVGVLHGGKSQDQREETLDFFRKGEYQILVASDVAARGLDIPDVAHVFNFDCPNSIQNYCHRIGRTGRAGKSGIATTFVTDADTEVMYDLKSYLESTDMPVPQQLAKHASAQAPMGSRDDKGNLVGSKKDSVQYLRERS